MISGSSILRQAQDFQHAARTPVRAPDRYFATLYNTQAFSSKLPSAQNIVKLYRMVMGLNAYIGSGPGKKAGIWVETEMEKYQCIQCGHCCLNLYDAFCTSAYEEDMIRWEEEGRWDMQKKLTVTIDEEVYEGLREVIGPRKISRFIEDLVRPHVIKKEIYAAYKEMAADEVRESEALEWAEATFGDVNDEAR
jgi:predicted CopG family antitoxin